MAMQRVGSFGLQGTAGVRDRAYQQRQTAEKLAAAQAEFDSAAQ